MLRRSRRNRSNRRIVAALSDIHSGYRLGLCNPEVVLVAEDDEGGIYEWTPDLNVTQQNLWRAYLDNIEQLAKFAGSDEIIIVHSGDATQGDSFNALIPEITKEDQRVIARENLLPLVSLQSVRKARLVTGTEVHVPEAAEARVAWMLAKATGKDVASLHHVRLDVDGVVFDVAHHGPHPGSRDWLRGNVARFYLRDRAYIDRRMGLEPAAAYIRGHYHEYVPETVHDRWRGTTRRLELVVVPSFSGMTHFARKVTKSTPTLTTGMVAFEVVNGRLRGILPIIQTWDLRCEEEL